MAKDLNNNWYNNQNVIDLHNYVTKIGHIGKLESYADLRDYLKDVSNCIKQAGISGMETFHICFKVADIMVEFKINDKDVFNIADFMDDDFILSLILEALEELYVDKVDINQAATNEELRDAIKKVIEENKDSNFPINYDNICLANEILEQSAKVGITGYNFDSTLLDEYEKSSGLCTDYRSKRDKIFIIKSLYQIYGITRTEDLSKLSLSEISAKLKELIEGLKSKNFIIDLRNIDLAKEVWEKASSVGLDIVELFDLVSLDNYEKDLQTKIEAFNYFVANLKSLSFPLDFANLIVINCDKDIIFNLNVLINSINDAENIDWWLKNWTNIAENIKMFNTEFIDKMSELCKTYDLLPQDDINKLIETIKLKENRIKLTIKFLDFQNKFTPLFNNSKITFPVLKTEATDKETLEYLYSVQTKIREALKKGIIDNNDEYIVSLNKQIEDLIKLYEEVCKVNNDDLENIKDILKDLTDLNLKVADINSVSKYLKDNVSSLKKRKKLLNILEALNKIDEAIKVFEKNNATLDGNTTLKQLKEVDDMAFWDIQIAISLLSKKLKSYNRKSLLNINFKGKSTKLSNGMVNLKEKITGLFKKEKQDDQEVRDLYEEFYEYVKLFDDNSLTIFEISDVIPVLGDLCEIQKSKSKKNVYGKLYALFKELNEEINDLSNDEYELIYDINDILIENEKNESFKEIVALLNEINVYLAKILARRNNEKAKSHYYKKRMNIFLAKIKNKTLNISEIPNVIFIIDNLLDNEKNKNKKAKLDNIKYHLETIREDYIDTFGENNDESLGDIVKNGVDKSKYKKLSLIIADLDWVLGYKEEEKREVYKFFKTCKKYSKEEAEKITGKKIVSWNNKNQKHLDKFKKIVNPSMTVSFAESTAKKLDSNLANIIELDNNGNITKESYVAYLKAKDEKLSQEAKKRLDNTLTEAKEYVAMLENNENELKSVKVAYRKKVGLNVTIGALITSAVIGLGGLGIIKGMNPDNEPDNNPGITNDIDEENEQNDEVHSETEALMKAQAIKEAKSAIVQAYDVIKQIEDVQSKNELTKLVYSLNAIITGGSSKDIVDATNTLVTATDNALKVNNDVLDNHEKLSVEDNNEENKDTKPNVNQNTNLEYLDFGTKIDTIDDADLYTNMYNLANDVNAKTSYFGSNADLGRMVDAVVFSNEDNSKIVLAHNAEEAAKYLDMGYEVDGYRLTNKYSFDENGNIGAYEGYVDAKDVYVLNLKK